MMSQASVWVRGSPVAFSVTARGKLTKGFQVPCCNQPLRNFYSLSFGVVAKITISEKATYLWEDGFFSFIYFN